MNYPGLYSIGLSILLCCSICQAQEDRVQLREPDHNKPALFSDLPEKMTSFKAAGLSITNFEMETSAIYGLGRLMGHHCLSINTMVANRTTHQFSADNKKAIDQMITRSLDVLTAI